MIGEISRSDQCDFLGVKNAILGEVDSRRIIYAVSVDEGLRVCRLKHCVIPASVLKFAT